ncbi:Transcription factor VIP1 [Sesamum angolense]|uniref:Transcription factor VIP1 n=1 Tax=Sesamum angolense TaxID=2727404 RepID=A0AAE2BJ71_9LAMI|nr:Transcription factor VIP1 [Sesamum angolense]
MMDLKFAGKPIPATPSLPARADLDQMPDTPTRRAQHRRAHSDTFFRFPDLDDILLDDVVADLNLDLPPTPPSLLSNAPPPPAKTAVARPGAHLRSLSMDADFFEGLGLDGPPPTAEVGAGPRHKHSNSMDGYSSATSSEVDSNQKKAMAADRLAELALIDPKRAKRILANRQSAARSKERKIRYTSELERKVQTLQAEATTLSAQITLLHMLLCFANLRDTTGLTAENKELKLKLQAMEQQAHLRDALNDALRNELQRLKIAAGQIPAVNGNNRGLSSQVPSHTPSLHYFGNHQAQQQPLHSHTHNNPRLDGQSSQPSFQDFNQRA